MSLVEAPTLPLHKAPPPVCAGRLASVGDLVPGCLLPLPPPSSTPVLGIPAQLRGPVRASDGLAQLPAGDLPQQPRLGHVPDRPRHQNIIPAR